MSSPETPEESAGQYSVDDDDQLSQEDTLIDRGVDDLLDEGYSPPDKWIEPRDNETLDELLSEEEPDPAMQLDGANVVVTGGARGIGAALVRRFHAAGANVVVADVLDASPVAEPLGRAVAVHADVSTEAGNVALIDAAVAAFGPVDLFFANAGLAIGTDLTMPEQEWELAMHVTSTLTAGRRSTSCPCGSSVARGTSARRRRRRGCWPRSVRRRTR